MTDEATAPPRYHLDSVERIYKLGPHTVRAVNDVSLDIGAGEFVAICGSSGSGKTTLLQLLGGLDRPTAGTLEFDGTAMQSMGDKEMTRLRGGSFGFVFQHFNLVPTLTAEENVEAALATAPGSRAEHRLRAAE